MFQPSLRDWVANATSSDTAGVAGAADGLSRVTEVTGQILHLGVTPYLEAWELQRELAAAVKEGSAQDTVLFL